MRPTPDGRLLLAGGTSGLVTLRWLHSLQVCVLVPGVRGCWLCGCGV